MFPIPWNFPFRKKDGSLGKINDLSTSYSLPTASSETKGGIKVGTGATMDGETMNIDAQLPAYTSEEAGKVLGVTNEGTLAWVTVSGGVNRYGVMNSVISPSYPTTHSEGGES